MSKVTNGHQNLAFNEDSQSRDATYFGYYGMLTNQQNMLQDNIRTGAYFDAITLNKIDFLDKIILDVGAGTGILSFFAVQSGARHVYAVEASPMANIARKLVEGNNLQHKITVIQGKLEDIQLPEKVDIIVSEPMGVILVHERMMETLLIARDRFLKPNGHMFPTHGHIYLAPFTDQQLYVDNMTKSRFWDQSSFYNIDLSGLKSMACDHHFSQPVVGCFDPRTLLADAVEKNFDLERMSLEEMQQFNIEFVFEANFTGIVHGIAGWFDVSFLGSETQSRLSTSPFAPKTHWYQIRFLFKMPIAINMGQILQGHVQFNANDRRSYDIVVHVQLENLDVECQQIYHLDEQQYYYINSTGDIPNLMQEQFNLYQKID